MPRARPAVMTSSRSGAAARPSCRSSSAWCLASTMARSTCRYRSTRKWSVTSSAISRRPGPSTAILATRKPRRFEDLTDEQTKARTDPPGQRGQGSRPDAAGEPAEAQPGRATDPRPEGFGRARRSAVLAQADRGRRQEVPGIGDRERREQSRPRRRRPGRIGSACRKRHRDEAFRAARPWPFGPCVQTIFAADDRGSSGRGERLNSAQENTMGQKINPIGLRLGINRTWDSRWFAGKSEYGKLLHEDVKIREILHKELKQAAVARIVIERPHKKCRVTIHSARPGVVIGKKGADIEKLRRKVAQLTDSDVVINIVEIRKPGLDAQLVAESIAQQLERRVAFRRAMKRAVQSAMRLGAEGIRIICSGRLGGAEIARLEWYREGRVPLHTLRADVDYGTATAHTAYGTCGIKVWIFKGEILEHDPMAQDKKMAEQDHSGGGGERRRRERDAA